MIRRRFWQKLTLWAFVLTCAAAIVSLAQARMLCEMGEVSSRAAPASESGKSSQHSRSDGHNHAHGGGHDHAQNLAHDHSENSHESEHAKESSSEEECCDKIGPTNFVSVFSKPHDITFGLSCLTALCFTVATLENLYESEKSKGVPRVHPSIPPPLSPHIPSTILRI